MLKRFLKDEAGATAMIFALAMPVFIGGIVFAVELGHWHQQKSELQDMADTSAIAAAHEIMLLGDSAEYEFAGKGHAFENGFQFGKGNVTVVSPPSNAKYSDRKDLVEVVMDRRQDMYFAQYFGNKSLNIQTRAIAAVLQGGEACILALNPTDSETIQVGGSSSVDVKGCRLHANSTGVNAIDVTNLSAECVSAGGNIRTSSATQLDCPSPLEGSRPIKDPYSDISIPDSVSSMPCLDSGIQGGGKKSNTTLPKAGRYCNSLTVSNDLIFNEPGTYYLDGATLNMKSSSSVIYGYGVSIVFMNGASLFGANGGDIRIKASTTGPFAGMALYFDKTAQPSDHLKINGNNSSNIEGVIYAPHVSISMNGGANQHSQCTQVIAAKVWFSGNSGFTNAKCDEIPGVRKIASDSGVTLVE